MRAHAQTPVKNAALVEQRLDALIRAAIEVFSKKGYHSARVSEVAKIAGISQGTVYNYVRSKEDLLLLVCRDNLVGYERIVRVSTLNAPAGLERLRALLEATVRAVSTYKNHHMIMVRELHHLDAKRRREFLSVAAEKRAVCEAILVDAAKEAGIDVAHPLLAANLLIFLPNLIVSRGWDFRKNISEEEVERFLVEFMWKGLGLPPLAGDEPRTRAKTTLAPSVGDFDE